LTGAADAGVCDHPGVLGRRIARTSSAVLVAACALAGTAAARAHRDSDPVQPASPALLVSVGDAPAGAPLPPGYLGVSMEYVALHQYTGSGARINPVLVSLLRSLASPAGGPMVLRIGGDSTDQTWWPAPSAIPPDGVRYALTPGWVRAAAQLADAVPAKLILGLNLAAGRPALAAAERRALVHGLGRARISAFELGNEADLYNRLAWYRLASGRGILSRPPSYDLAAFTGEFSAWRGVTGSEPIAGPAFANLAWMKDLGAFLDAEPGLGLVTFHRYPLRGCNVGPDSPSYPTLSNLLSDYSTHDLAAGVAPFAALAHARGLQFRVDEMNSVACSGRTGLSDTFASSLWMLDTLFEMRAAGVDGVNVHTLPGAAYQLFSFTHDAVGWHAFVHPDYYGMLMFAQAFPTGAVLLPVSGAGGQVKVWATRSPDGRVRVVLINKDPSGSHLVLLRAPAGDGGGATVETLRAPSPTSTSGVSYGQQSFGASTETGELPGQPRSSAVQPVAGMYSITLPPASADLLAP
jgi:hypothetical protein